MDIFLTTDGVSCKPARAGWARKNRDDKQTTLTNKNSDFNRIKYPFS